MDATNIAAALRALSYDLDNHGPAPLCQDLLAARDAAVEQIDLAARLLDQGSVGAAHAALDAAWPGEGWSYPEHWKAHAEAMEAIEAACDPSPGDLIRVAESMAVSQ